MIRSSLRGAPPEMTTTSSHPPLASSSVNHHLLRGTIGLLAVLGAILLLGVLGPISLVLLPVAAVAWRGCPTCWAVGMMGTLSDRRTTAPACPVAEIDSTLVRFARRAMKALPAGREDV